MDKKQFKLYYNVKEVAELVGEEVSTIYYWEKAYDLTLPEAKTSAKRRYRKQDVDKMLLIKHLVRDKKLTNHGVKRALQVGNIDVLTRRAEAMELLNSSLDTISTMISELDAYQSELQRLKVAERKLANNEAKLFDFNE